MANGAHGLATTTEQIQGLNEARRLARVAFVTLLAPAQATPEDMLVNLQAALGVASR